MNAKKRSGWRDPVLNPEKRKREGIPFLFVKSWDCNFTSCGILKFSQRMFSLTFHIDLQINCANHKKNQCCLEQKLKPNFS